MRLPYYTFWTGCNNNQTPALNARSDITAAALQKILRAYM
jgi:hypothetical protein